MQYTIPPTMVFIQHRCAQPDSNVEPWVRYSSASPGPGRRNCGKLWKRPMILRLSDALSKKIKLTPTELAPLNANPFADWSCHCFAAGGAPFVLAANTASFYTVVFPGRRITRHGQFESSLLGQLQEFIVRDGFEFIYKRLIDSEGADVSYSRPLNPVVTGALTDLSELAAHLLEEEKRPPDEVANRINRSPLSVIKHAHPRDAFRALSFPK